MDHIQRQVQQLELKNKDDLWELLGEELGDAYGGELPSNLSVEFAKACYNRIAPKEDPHDRLRRDAEDYSEKWVENNRPQKINLKALRLLLCERVGREQHNLISSPSINLLSQLIVAMRTADEGEQRNVEREEYLEYAPQKESRPKPKFEDTFPFEDIYSHELEQWLSSQRSANDGGHAVYILDCTPPVGDEERDVIRELRGKVESKGFANSPREKAALAANNDECVYYIGKTTDVAGRMERHDIGQTDGGAKFTELFKPSAILKVTWYDTDNDAREEEKRTAKELSEPGGPYAFSETFDK